MRGSLAFQLRTTIALVTLVGAAAACGSDPAAKHPNSSNPGSSGGGAAAVGGSSGASGNATPGMTVNGLALPGGDTPTARLHRLTTSELKNSLQDLLGEGVPLEDAEPDSVVDGFASIGARVASVSPSGVGLYEGAARAATAFVFADPARSSAQLTCVPQAATDMACLNQAIAAFGRRAFRRPLTDAEVTRFSSLASSIAAKPGSSIQQGLRSVLNAILQSPSFLYRVELGTPSAADGGKLKYTDYEMASRLAATLWDSVPDDALLDAAAAGMLQTPDGVKAQAARLLADGKAHRALRAFVGELYGSSHLAEAIKDPALFPKWSDSLKPLLQQELEMRVEDMVFTQKGDFCPSTTAPSRS